jgi:hypothetical protein
MRDGGRIQDVVIGQEHARRDKESGTKGRRRRSLPTNAQAAYGSSCLQGLVQESHLNDVAFADNPLKPDLIGRIN